MDQENYDAKDTYEEEHAKNNGPDNPLGNSLIL